MQLTFAIHKLVVYISSMDCLNVLFTHTVFATTT